MTRSNRAMIVAPQNEAADAGAQMLLAGGNAVVRIPVFVTADSGLS